MNQFCQGTSKSWNPNKVSICHDNFVLGLRVIRSKIWYTRNWKPSKTKQHLAEWKIRWLATFDLQGQEWVACEKRLRNDRPRPLPRWLIVWWNLFQWIKLKCIVSSCFISSCHFHCPFLVWEMVEMPPPLIHWKHCKYWDLSQKHIGDQWLELPALLPWK